MGDDWSHNKKGCLGTGGSPRPGQEVVPRRPLAVASVAGAAGYRSGVFLKPSPGNEPYLWKWRKIQPRRGGREKGKGQMRGKDKQKPCS